MGAGVLFSLYHNTPEPVVVLDSDSSKESTRSYDSNSMWSPSAYFVCTDQSYFIAGFPDNETLNIFVDGILTESFPRASNTGYRYEDVNSVYVFAGEGVSVTEKSTATTITCMQPQNAHSAPMNFGDALSL